MVVEEKIVCTRIEAKAKGSKRYFTSQPCPRSHVVERMVSNGACTECRRENKEAARQAARPVREPSSAPVQKVVQQLEKPRAAVQPPKPRKPPLVQGSTIVVSIQSGLVRFVSSGQLAKIVDSAITSQQVAQARSKKFQPHVIQDSWFEQPNEFSRATAAELAADRVILLDQLAWDARYWRAVVVETWLKSPGPPPTPWQASVLHNLYPDLFPEVPHQHAVQILREGVVFPSRANAG